MIRLSDETVSREFECPYIPGRNARYRFFHARDLTAAELEVLLSKGWRKFGIFFFRPDCLHCQECQPIRVLAQSFGLSKSQRRVERKAHKMEVSVEFKSLNYRREIFDIYSKHNLRFDKESNEADFIDSFYTQSCPALQSEYFVGDTLFAVGFLDVSYSAMSSVYFIFDTDYSDLSPGTLSVLLEIGEARKRNMQHYYLGYYISENKSMNYKNRFAPHEIFDWSLDEWKRAKCEL